MESLMNAYKYTKKLVNVEQPFYQVNHLICLNNL